MVGTSDHNRKTVASLACPLFSAARLPGTYEGPCTGSRSGVFTATLYAVALFTVRLFITKGLVKLRLASALFSALIGLLAVVRAVKQNLPFAHKSVFCLTALVGIRQGLSINTQATFQSIWEYNKKKAYSFEIHFTKYTPTALQCGRSEKGVHKYVRYIIQTLGSSHTPYFLVIYRYITYWICHKSNQTLKILFYTPFTITGHYAPLLSGNKNRTHDVLIKVHSRSGHMSIWQFQKGAHMEILIAFIKLGACFLPIFPLIALFSFIKRN